MTSDRLADVPEHIREAARDARSQYERVYSEYRAFAESVATVLKVCLQDEESQILSVAPRAKEPGSFERKAATRSKDDPTQPKYPDPINDITDKAGVRVITYFLSAVRSVARVVEKNFDVIQKLDKGMEHHDQVGYESLHFLVQYPQNRTALQDFKRYDGLLVEIQVRTILQHAWAEIEHDIQYKAAEAPPSEISRRFNALAGLIQIADREFQGIKDEDHRLLLQTEKHIAAGLLSDVEITADSVRLFLNRHLGPDRHMSPYSYRWLARLLRRRLGFVNLAEVDECVSGYDADQISAALHDYRQSQMTRFQDMLLASMGESFVSAHPLTATDSEFPYELENKINRLVQAGIEIRGYRPPGYREGLSEWDESS